MEMIDPKLRYEIYVGDEDTFYVSCGSLHVAAEILRIRDGFVLCHYPLTKLFDCNDEKDYEILQRSTHEAAKLMRNRENAVIQERKEQEEMYKKTEG